MKGKKAVVWILIALGILLLMLGAACIVASMVMTNNIATAMGHLRGVACVRVFGYNNEETLPDGFGLLIQEVRKRHERKNERFQTECGERIYRMLRHQCNGI